jgi:hypothetical protein
MRKFGNRYIDKKCALGVGKARRRNTKPTKRLAHKVERREAKREAARPSGGQ